MLKHLWINKQQVPVPIPIQTVADACDWIESRMLPRDKSVTRVFLDGRDISEMWQVQGASRGLHLQSSSRLELTVDSPRELAAEVVEAALRLMSELLHGLKPLAVTLWQSQNAVVKPEIEKVVEDLQLMLDLIEHLKSLKVLKTEEFHLVDGLQQALQTRATALTNSVRQQNWRSAAEILLRDSAHLKGVETILQEMVSEFDSFHIRILTGN